MHIYNSDYKEYLITISPNKLTQDQIKSLGFIRTKVVLSYDSYNKGIYYNIDLRWDVGDLTHPGVYLIVQEFSDEMVLVVYVGKAGRGLNRRFHQHKSGYERNRQMKITSVGTQKMIDKFNSSEMEPRMMHVWFRKSNVNQLGCALSVAGDSEHLTSTYVSMYSTEEEALILYFLNEGQSLINRSIPRAVLEESDFPSSTSINHLTSLEMASNGLKTFPELDALTVKLAETSTRKGFEEWCVSLAGWDTSTKECFSATLQNLNHDEIFQGRTPKIIGSYTTGPFRGIPILVFGELVKARFRRGTNNLIFTLDGKYMVKYPFDKRLITLIALEEYCAI